MGLILLGSFIKRNNYLIDPSGLFQINSKIPILTITGELDGVARIIRAG